MRTPAVRSLPECSCYDFLKWLIPLMLLYTDDEKQSPKALGITAGEVSRTIPSFSLEVLG